MNCIECEKDERCIGFAFEGGGVRNCSSTGSKLDGNAGTIHRETGSLTRGSYGGTIISLSCQRASPIPPPNNPARDGTSGTTETWEPQSTIAMAMA